MSNLIINRIKFKVTIPDEGIQIYCSKSDALFRLEYQYFIERLINHSRLEEFKNWFGSYDGVDVKERRFVYFDFQKLNSKDSFPFMLDEKLFNKSFKWHFVKHSLINHFKNKNFLIEPYPIGKNLSVYFSSESFNDEWDTYSRFDLIINSYRKEIVFNKTSENVLISKTEKGEDSFPNIEFIKLRAIDPTSQFIGKIKYIVRRPLRIIANNDIRKGINVSISPKKVSYKKLYGNLKQFYTDHLLDIKMDTLQIHSGGLARVPDKDVGIVYHGSNVMVFKNEKNDINAATGMRNYGPFQFSPIGKEIQFIFIYENSDDANKLYQYLKNGLKHFPGLQTYVGIPPTLSDLKLKYDTLKLKENFDGFLSKNLPDDTYENYFVILIGPFKKGQQPENLRNLYYCLKKQLLKKNISSQFIYYQNIRSDQFHFYLPNIAIAILAKLAGIPWKLKEQPYKELIIGFNIRYVNKTKYIGSAVFFDNQGYLQKVHSYEGQQLSTIVEDMRQTIETFRKETTEEEMKRVIIHTYKPYGRIERKIEDLLHKELQLDIPFVYIEINEAKTTTEICFDEDYEYGMPVSGTYVKTRKYEYLLFNNTRYHKKPLRSVTEEWPIKIRIYADDYEAIDEKQLISQVYEFSRLYWKGLKQKSQPVTTIYSKLIAEYAGNFDEQIPKNEISQKTPWFL